MSSRKRVLTGIEAQVLMLSRRRCCVCFGLNRDAALKAGQIAHIDKDNSNNSLTNLAFLCLDHHDEYDSVTSQRKGLTKHEVLQYRDELHKFVDASIRRDVPFGSLDLEYSPALSGHFIRLEPSQDSAEITITPLPSTFEGREQVHVSGHAFWGTHRPFGPNMGALDFIMELIDESTAAYARDDYKITIHLSGDRLSVMEENWPGVHGMNVTFCGEYKK
ncbi:hypothetical protein [Alterinioella nitratireducens]|uniref:hypothetical protein n=1 Tax=Alterinioella nitratireducens TaxID=2735915 RepID=UPI0040587038